MASPEGTTGRCRRRQPPERRHTMITAPEGRQIDPAACRCRPSGALASATTVPAAEAAGRGLSSLRDFGSDRSHRHPAMPALKLKVNDEPGGRRFRPQAADQRGDSRPGPARIVRSAVPFRPSAGVPSLIDGATLAIVSPRGGEKCPPPQRPNPTVPRPNHATQLHRNHRRVVPRSDTPKSLSAERQPLSDCPD